MECLKERKRQLEEGENNNNNCNSEAKKPCLETAVDVLDSLLVKELWNEILSYLTPFDLCAAMPVNKRWKKECMKDIYWIEHLKRASKVLEYNSTQHWLKKPTDNWVTLLDDCDWNKIKEFDSPAFSMFQQYKTVIGSSDTEVIALVLLSNVTYHQQEIREVDNRYRYWTSNLNRLRKNSDLWLLKHNDYIPGSYCLHSPLFYQGDVDKIHPLDWKSHFHCFNKEEPGHECKPECRGEMRQCSRSIGFITRSEDKGLITENEDECGCRCLVKYQGRESIQNEFYDAYTLVYSMYHSMKNKHHFNIHNSSCIQTYHPFIKEYVDSIRTNITTLEHERSFCFTSIGSGNKSWICGHCKSHHGPGVRIIYLKKYLTNCSNCNSKDCDLTSEYKNKLDTFYLACFICIQEVVDKYKISEKIEFMCKICDHLSKIEWIK